MGWSGIGRRCEEQQLAARIECRCARICHTIREQSRSTTREIIEIDVAIKVRFFARISEPFAIRRSAHFRATKAPLTSCIFRDLTRLAGLGVQRVKTQMIVAIDNMLAFPAPFEKRVKASAKLELSRVPKAVL